MHREAMVTSSGGTSSARMTKKVDGGGSSMAFNRIGAASVTRWNSVRRSTLRRPSEGLREARLTMVRAWSRVMNGPSRSVTDRSG
jgi:hypothetical protein